MAVNSDVGVGSLLAQRCKDDDKVLVPIAFFHHALTEAEKRYNTTEKELLAVVLSIKKFRVYLCKRFALITDHKAVRFLKTLDANDEKGRKGRWIEFLQEYDIVPHYRSGSSYELSMADYLSRVTLKKEETEVRSINAVVSKIDGGVFVQGSIGIDEIKEAQKIDSQVKLWVKEVTEGKSFSTIEVERMVIDNEGLLRIKYSGGRRTRKRPWGVKELYRVVVPESCQKSILYLVHDSPGGGHMGYKRTLKRCREIFWWKGMVKDIKEYVQKCERCGKNKHITNPNVAPLQVMDMPEKVFDKLQVDFLGPFPHSTAHEYIYALQIQDILSRYVVFVPTKDNTALTAASVVFEDWLCKFGPPLIIQSDRGSHFSAEVFNEMCKLAGIKHKMGAPGHAQSQGQVERQNQLGNLIRCLSQNKLDRWPQAMVRVSFAHNTSENETTGISPYELVYGCKPRTVEKVFFSEKGGSSNKLDLAEYAEELGIAKTALAKEAKVKTVEAQQARADECFRKGEQYRLGDIVRIKLSTAERGKLGGKKMAPIHSDPYVVCKVLGRGWTYILEPANGIGRQKTRHFNELIEVSRGKSDIVDGGDTIQVTDVTVSTQNKVPVPKWIPPRKRGGGEMGGGTMTEIRRSKRVTKPPSRLILKEAPGKRYVEESIPLAEDVGLSEEEGGEN